MHAENLYMVGFAPLLLYTTVIHDLVFGRSTMQEMQFLPLMLTSVYCAVGVIWAFLRLAAVAL